jgi:hypothetical protein
MTKTFLGRTWYGWTWRLRPKQIWLRATINRHNQGVDNGHRAAHRNLTQALNTNRAYAKRKGADYLKGYEFAQTIVERQFDWILND